MESPDPQIILYPDRTGRPDFALRVEGGTVWLTQAETAELFQTTTPNISLHILNILKESELDQDSVVKESLITAADGKNYRAKEIAVSPLVADSATTEIKRACRKNPTVAFFAMVPHEANHSERKLDMLATESARRMSLPNHFVGTTELVVECGKFPFSHVPRVTLSANPAGEEVGG